MNTHDKIELPPLPPLHIVPSVEPVDYPEVARALIDYARTAIKADRQRRNKALQAECEKLREHLQNLIDQTTPLEPVPGNPMWSRRIQLDAVIEERDSLRAECERLRKDAERYRWLREQCGNSGLLTIAKVGAFELKAWSGDDPDAAIDAAMQGAKP